MYKTPTKAVYKTPSKSWNMEFVVRLESKRVDNVKFKQNQNVFVQVITNYFWFLLVNRVGN